MLHLQPSTDSHQLTYIITTTHTSPTYAEAPLGYREAMIRSSAASPLPLPAPSYFADFMITDSRAFIDIVDVTLGHPMSREVGYGITDVWDDMVEDMDGGTTLWRS
ncbi:hypothetical protein Tco_0645772 [Tanacetum coccineum]